MISSNVDVVVFPVAAVMALPGFNPGLCGDPTFASPALAYADVRALENSDSQRSGVPRTHHAPGWALGIVPRAGRR